jgi:hypothetical protein
MVVVSKDNMGDHDPEVLMGDWTEASVVDIPLTRVDTPPQPQSSTTTGGPATVLAGPKGTQTSLTATNASPTYQGGPLSHTRIYHAT